MKKFLHKIEVIVDILIPYMLALLLAIIISDIFFHDFAKQYHIYFLICDYVVIFVFVLDLVFKYIRIKCFPTFFKKCWPDILAVFPFFLLFRLFEGVIGLFSKSLGEGAQTVQSLLHEGLGVEKEGVKISREIEKLGKVSRSNTFARFIRPIFRLPRFIKAIHFYEKPTGRHHVHEKP